MRLPGRDALRLFLVAGLLMVPAPGGSDQPADGAAPLPGPSIALSPLSPIVIPPAPEPAGAWIAARRDQPRTSPRLLALLTMTAASAALVGSGILRSPGLRRRRFVNAGRTISSRAPPCLRLA